MYPQTLTVRFFLAVLLAALCFPSVSCRYDPPPEILSTSPESGAGATQDTVLRVRFSEPINPATLQVVMWRQMGRLFDEDGQLYPPCGEGQTEQCVHQWMGPFRLDQGDLFNDLDDVCSCRVRMDFQNTVVELRQDCRAYQFYQDWACRSFSQGAEELCREFTNGEPGECTLAAQADAAVWKQTNLAMTENITELTIDPAGLMPLGSYLLQIWTGLADLDGNDTGAPLELFFGVTPTGALAPTDFRSGVFLTWLDLSEPLAYPLEVIWIVNVDPDTGLVVGSGCDADPQDITIDHTNHEVSDWFPWPYVYDLGYNFPIDGQVQNIEVEGVSGYNFRTNPFRIYAGPPIEVEVMDGTIEANIFYNEALGRQELNGFLNSPETYILSSRESGGTPEVARGVVYGFRLTEEEVALYENGHAHAWGVCVSPDEDAEPEE